jgi:hypothetical protein
MACVLLAAGYFLHRAWPEVRQGLRDMAPALVVLSVALTVMAKLALGENARIAARRCGIGLGYGTALRLYNISQLGKYIPGSIWQFVGRAAAYRSRNAGYAAIRDSLLVESLWVVASAMIVGVALIGMQTADLLRESAPAAVLYWLGGLAGAGILLLAGAFVWKRTLLARYLRLAWPGPWLVAVQVVTWALLGSSFWMLARAAHVDIGAFYATGLFALAFAFGFMVPIAPAGLGIRDGILTLGLLPYTSLQTAVIITIVARLVYLVAELGLAGVQELAVAMIRRTHSSAA